MLINRKKFFAELLVASALSPRAVVSFCGFVQLFHFDFLCKRYEIRGFSVCADKSDSEWAELRKLFLPTPRSGAMTMQSSFEWTREDAPRERQTAPQAQRIRNPDIVAVVTDSFPRV
jgi:hypothetical protein